MLISDLSITTKKGRKLVQNLNLIVNAGDKVALIGEEGDGKSTFIKALVDLKLISSYATVTGNISIEKPIGYLHQFLEHSWDEQTVMDFFLKESPLDDPDYDIYNDLSNIASKFHDFGLNSDLLYSEQKIGTLSGGEKVKLQLVKINYKKPAVFLFDEPTNDVDIKTLEILEDFIKKCTIPVIFVSHDETFIENTANIILHFEQLKRKTEFKYTLFKGGLKDYNQFRQRTISNQNNIAKIEEKNYNEKMSTIQRLLDAGAGDKVVKRLVSQRERLEKKGLPDYVDTEVAMGLMFDDVEMPNNKVVCDLHLDELKIDNKSLSKDIDLMVIGAQKVVIIGENGAGKTTLLKKIYENVKQKPNIKVGYMPQNYRELMDFGLSPIDFLCPNGDKNAKTFAYTLMGCCKFTSEEMMHNIGDLSGGQQAKLYLLKMVIEKSNCLILDEPTRNLSPMSNPVVRSVLKDFGGAIISVSHDRKFISEVCDKVYELTPKGLKETSFNISN